ncbi:MAG: acyl-CoA dehydrogenase family protein [Bacteroidales bacterium]|nr:acyl-CoA dehydrogenase family protein [Bacteroidales bacterium]MCF8328540.1 acyl-CoA dehydrogenase family protein [Bacteroidales bacterium]
MANFFTDNKHLKFHLSHPLMKKIVELKERNFEDYETYDDAPKDFEDALDNFEKVLDIIGEIAGDTIAENAEDVDATGAKVVDNHVEYAEGTKENIEKLKNANLFGLSLPRKYLGLNFPIVPYVMSAEIISRADAGFANIWGLQDCAETIHEFADEEMRQEVLPRFNRDGITAAMDLTEPDSGSDLQSVQLKAHYDEQKGTWMLNGVKRFITNGDADVALVLARSEEGTKDGRGLSLFLYDKKADKMSVRRVENKLGIKGSPTCELVFKDAPAELIGNRKMGLIKYVMALMNSARLGVGAQSVGIAEAAYREALTYAHDREQFGSAIIKFPAVYEMLTDMETKVAAMRSLLYETSRYVDIYKTYQFISEDRKLEKEERQEMKKYQRLADVFTPLTKLFSSEYANQVAYDALQVHGGSGYMKDYPVERIFRDARITNIYEGTSQLQVVAAIRGVGNGTFLNVMNDFSENKVKPELEYLQKMLGKMKDQYEKAVRKVRDMEDDEYWDFHARRLVEMAGNIIIGHLLLADSNRDQEYDKAASLFINKGRSQNIQHYSYINNIGIRELGDFKK